MTETVEEEGEEGEEETEQEREQDGEDAAVQPSPAKKPRATARARQSTGAAARETAAAMEEAEEASTKSDSDEEMKDTEEEGSQPQTQAQAPTAVESQPQPPAQHEPAVPMSPPPRRAQLLAPATPYDASPSGGGLKLLPTRTSYPAREKTPRGKGVSTLLGSVPPPETIFLSPFPADAKYARRLTVEEEEVEMKQQLPVTMARRLRPTAEQERAEQAVFDRRSRSRSRSSGGLNGPQIVAGMRKEDTPTINRARSRLANEMSSLPLRRGVGITEEEAGGAEENEATPARHARRTSSGGRLSTHQHHEQQQEVPQSKLRPVRNGVRSVGGWIPNRDATWPWVAGALLLLGLAHLLILAAVGPPSEDRLRVRSNLKGLQDRVNSLVGTYVQPHVASYGLNIPQMDWCWLLDLCTQFHVIWFLVPLLYLLAAGVLRKGYEVSTRDLMYLEPRAMPATQIAQQRYARHVFIVCHALVSIMAAVVYFYAAQNAAAAATKVSSAPAPAPAAARPGSRPTAATPSIAASVPQFDLTWVSTHLILTSFGWSLSELVHFAPFFSVTHTIFFAIMHVCSEVAWWSVVPQGVVSVLPAVVQRLLNMARPFLPVATGIFSLSLLVPLTTMQGAESMKACAGVSCRSIARVLLVVAPCVYMAALVLAFQPLSSESRCFIEAIALIVAAAALSCYESMSSTSRRQFVLEKAQ